MNKKTLLLPSEAGRYFRPPISADRVRQLCDIGQLNAITTASGHRLIPLDDVLRLAHEREQKKLANTANAD
jgi:hypothetical protein